MQIRNRDAVKPAHGAATLPRTAVSQHEQARSGTQTRASSHREAVKPVNVERKG